LLITLNSVREPSQFKDWQLKSCEIGRSEGLILKGTIFEPIQTQIYKAVCQAKNSEDALTSISILFEEAHTYCVQDTYRMQAQGPRRTHSKVFEGYLVKGPDDEVEKLRKVVDG
jgi:hypothetical protein